MLTDANGNELKVGSSIGDLQGNYIGKVKERCNWQPSNCIIYTEKSISDRFHIKRYNVILIPKEEKRDDAVDAFRYAWSAKEASVIKVGDEVVVLDTYWGASKVGLRGRILRFRKTAIEIKFCKDGHEFYIEGKYLQKTNQKEGSKMEMNETIARVYGGEKDKGSDIVVVNRWFRNDIGIGPYAVIQLTAIKKEVLVKAKELEEAAKE